MSDPRMGPRIPGSVRATASGEGRIRAGGVERDVTFERADPSLDIAVAVAEAIGEFDGLLVARLDVTQPADAEAAVAAAVDRFGRIDVLVNNAGNFQAGFFDELTPEQVERQLTTTLTGPMHVTRAVLPVMR